MSMYTDMQQRADDRLADHLVSLYPSLLRHIAIERGNYRGIAAARPEDKVSVVVGSGSGNEPWCLGYVGPGLADGAVAGPVYTAPSARAVLAVTRAVPHHKGVVYICTNHSGDVLNFELASELAGLEGIKTEVVRVTDDAASDVAGMLPPEDKRRERRGIAGVLLVVKAAAGAARLGLPIEDVVRVANKANENLSTIHVATSPVKDPQTGEVVVDLKEGFVDYGGGFNGEKAMFRREYRSLEETVDTVMDLLIQDLQPLPAADAAVLVNGSAMTGGPRLLAIADQAMADLRKNEVKVSRLLTEHAFSSAVNDGFSISLMTMDEELKTCLKEPAWTPLIHGFAGSGREPVL